MPSADGSLVLNRGPLLFSREVFALDAAPHIVGNNGRNDVTVLNAARMPRSSSNTRANQQPDAS
jgi:hypothetical protein